MAKKAPQSYFYFAERTSPQDNKIEPVVKKQGDIWWVEFDTCLHEFDVLGVNKRAYKGSNIWFHITHNEKLKSKIRRNDWFGEMDHPWVHFKNQELSPKRILSVYRPNRSHKILNPTMEGEKRLYGHIQTCCGTEAGRGFANDLIQGLIPTFSCRSTGGIQLINGKPYVIITVLVTYDWVDYPSFEAAEMTSNGITGRTRSITLTESGDDDIVSSNHICMEIPYEELGNDVMELDDNVKAYMESVDLDKDSFLGFNETGSHIALRVGERSTLYAGISSNTVDRVKDFYRSFHIR